MNHSNLHKILTKGSGTKWMQTFYSERLGIDREIETTVPALLPPEIIAAIHQRVDRNRTFERGKRPNGTPYLLGRMIYCDHCGYALFGQHNRGKARYYRHGHAERRKKCTCTCCKTWVPADKIEGIITMALIEELGNPIGVKRAIEKATPSLERVREWENRVKALEKSLGNIKASREKIIRQISRNTITDDDADKELSQLKEDETRISGELDALQDYLVRQPKKKDFERIAGMFSRRDQQGNARSYQYSDARMIAIKRLANDVESMSWEDKRALLEAFFAGKMPDGRRCGIYIRWDSSIQRKGNWTYAIRGRFYDEERCVINHEEVIKSLSCSPTRGLP